MLKQSGYSQTLAVTGGTGSINYAVTSGALPAGMSLSATTGTITGAPTALGTSTFQVTATDSLGSHDVRSFSITVNPASAYDILIEPNLQNFGSLTLDGTAISTADVTHTLLSVGSHTLSYTGGQLSFRVSTLGLITYDPTLEGVLEGVDTSVLRIYPLGITVDATALSSTSIALQSRNYSNTEPIYLLVLPGAESLLDLSTNDSVAFTVSPAGSIGYDSSLQGILNGSGTSELIAKGTAITIDATALSTPGVQVDGREFNNTAPLSLVVLPGAESLDDLSTGDGVAFTVSAAGTIGYDPSLQGILNGSGTPELIAEGTAITVDATALSTPSVQVDGREFDNTCAFDGGALARCGIPPRSVDRRRRCVHRFGRRYDRLRPLTARHPERLGDVGAYRQGHGDHRRRDCALDPRPADRRARVQQHSASEPRTLTGGGVPTRSVDRRRRCIHRLDRRDDRLRLLAARHPGRLGDDGAYRQGHGDHRRRDCALDAQRAGRRARVQQHSASEPCRIARGGILPRSVHRHRRFVHRLGRRYDRLRPLAARNFAWRGHLDPHRRGPDHHDRRCATSTQRQFRSTDRHSMRPLRSHSLASPGRTPMSTRASRHWSLS